MKFIVLSLMFLSVKSMAEIPHTFTGGNKVTATKMNENFQSLVPQICLLEERMKGSNNYLGSLSSGTWHSRRFSNKEGYCDFLNFENSFSNANFLNDTYHTIFSLVKGDYFIDCEGMIFRADRYQSILEQTTDGTIEATSPFSYAVSGSYGNSVTSRIKAFVSIDSKKNFAYKHRVQTTTDIHGQGLSPEGWNHPMTNATCKIIKMK